MASGASKYLNDLPSRGLFTSSTISSSNPGGMRVYVCQHDRTAPPEEQVIKTNATNILIRALTLKKGKVDSIPKDAKGKTTATSAKGKRAAESPADGKVAAKRVNTTPNSRAPKEEGSSSKTPEKEFHCYTVEKLRSVLKIRGLPTRGKKDDLIARLKDDKVDGQV